MRVHKESMFDKVSQHCSTISIETVRFEAGYVGNFTEDETPSSPVSAVLLLDVRQKQLPTSRRVQVLGSEVGSPTHRGDVVFAVAPCFRLLEELDTRKQNKNCRENSE